MSLFVFFFLKCKHQAFRFTIPTCVHFDFIEVHYRVVGAPQRERRFASEKRITSSRVIARRIIQTVRVRTTPLFTRVCAPALMHNVTRVRCTMRTMSNASALAHQDKLDDVVLDSCSDFRILYNMRKEYTIYVRIF